MLIFLSRNFATWAEPYKIAMCRFKRVPTLLRLSRKKQNPKPMVQIEQGNHVK